MGIKELLKKIIPKNLLLQYHRTLAYVGARRYGFPSQKLTVIGITGTNGKSSTVWILARMLEEAGYTVAASSTVEFQIGDRHRTNMTKTTMPGRFFLQRFLREAVDAGCTHAVVEVTSEGVLQHRHRFIDFGVAVFLNLSPEHLERHGSYEAYRAAKGELFKALAAEPQTSIVNINDKEAAYFLQFPAAHYIGFRIGWRQAHAKLPPSGTEFVAQNAQATNEGIQFSVNGVAFSSPLFGVPNIENALAATAAAGAVGVEPPVCAQALAKISHIPGRLEEITTNLNLRIFVDYAHTPEALESVYEALRTLGGGAAHLTCVLGATGGGRDRWKRPKLGEVAARFCDRIIVTNEDPYDEDPAVIMKDVWRGVEEGGASRRGEIVADRRVAIRRALSRAAPGGMVAITGKGCEPWMVVAGGKKVPWDDREIAVSEAEALYQEKLKRTSQTLH